MQDDSLEKIGSLEKILVASNDGKSFMTIKEIKNLLSYETNVKFSHKEIKLAMKKTSFKPKTKFDKDSYLYEAYWVMRNYSQK